MYRLHKQIYFRQSHLGLAFEQSVDARRATVSSLPCVKLSRSYIRQVMSHCLQTLRVGMSIHRYASVTYAEFEVSDFESSLTNKRHSSPKTHPAQPLQPQRACYHRPIPHRIVALYISLEITKRSEFGCTQAICGSFGSSCGLLHTTV